MVDRFLKSTLKLQLDPLCLCKEYSCHIRRMPMTFLVNNFLKGKFNFSNSSDTVPERNSLIW